MLSILAVAYDISNTGFAIKIICKYLIKHKLTSLSLYQKQYTQILTEMSLYKQESSDGVILTVDAATLKQIVMKLHQFLLSWLRFRRKLFSGQIIIKLIMRRQKRLLGTSNIVKLGSRSVQVRYRSGPGWVQVSSM